MHADLDVNVKDAPFDPDSPGRVIHYSQAKAAKPLYRVFLYLDGPDLPYVRRVTYELHPTFPEPVRSVDRTHANPRCKLEIHTWGLFQVRVVIEDKKGRRYARTHTLQYDKQFHEKGVAFVAS